MFGNYWEDYNPHMDYGSLLLTDTQSQSAIGDSSLNATSAGYDPVWIFERFGPMNGDRLRLLPQDLRDAVYEAMKGSTTSPYLMQYISVYSNGAVLNQLWAQEASVYLPELI